MTVSRPSSDTAHLYDGKTVRSAAPSRKKIAGQIGTGSEIPKDAIPEVEIPSFIESLLGGPLVPKTKFLPPAKMVQNLQLGVYGILVALALLTYMISPAEGTIWYMITGSLGAATVLQLILIAGATGTGNSMDMANMIKPALMKGNIKVIASSIDISDKLNEKLVNF